MRRRAAALLAALGLVLAAPPGVAAEAISFPPIQLEGARSARAPLTGDLALPRGAGPFPVVIVLHGCGGPSPHVRGWGDRLTAWGYGALLLDSFAPRGERSVCPKADQPRVTPADRAGDVLAAALHLRTLRRIDGERIGVLGFSHGGGTAVTVTETRFGGRYPGLLKAAVNYYGNCRRPELHGTIPLLALAGSRDDWGNPAGTCTAFAKKLRRDQPFEVKVYDGAAHGFDIKRRDRTVEGHALAYDEKATADGIARTRAFLDRWVRDAGRP